MHMYMHVAVDSVCQSVFPPLPTLTFSYFFSAGLLIALLCVVSAVEQDIYLSQMCRQ